MNKKILQNKQSFKTTLNTKEFEEVAIKTGEQLKLKSKNHYKLRRLIFSKSLNFYLFRIHLMTIELIYKGDSIEITNIESWKDFMSKDKQSKLVREFKTRFQSIQINYSKYSQYSDREENLAEICKTFENWSGYEINDVFPPMKVKPQEKPLLLITTSIITSILVGFLWAFFSINTVSDYFPLYETVASCMVASSMIIYLINKGIKKSNYSKEVPIKFILLGTILLTLFLNEYLHFLYWTPPVIKNPSVIGETLVIANTFLNFIVFKFDSSLELSKANYGILIFLITLLIRIILIYWMTNDFIEKNKFDPIPYEVDDFIKYHLLMGKTDDEVKTMLSEKGWIKQEDQNLALKAM